MPICAILLFLGAATITTPPWPFSSVEGTTWQYAFIRQPENDRTTLTRQIVPSSQSQKSKSLLQIDERMDGALRGSETLALEKGAILAVSRRVPTGKVTPLKPPVTVLPAKIEPGISWNFRGQIAGVDLTLPLKVLGEEEIQVTAGKFRAWHIRGEEVGAVATRAEQWFVPGVGWVKESIIQRSPTGQLLDRRVIEMTAAPSLNARVKPTPFLRPFEASISTSTAGEPTDIISADALQIVARWRLRQTTGNAKVRAVWIAEETGGIVPADYKIDEATAIATPPESVGTFTISRPSDGWAAGRYRVEFYVRNALVATTRINIAARASAANLEGEF